MRDRDYSTSIDFLNRFFSDAEGVVELRACHNERRGKPIPLFSNDPDEQRAYLEQRDIDGYGTYFGLGTRKVGATTGTKNDIQQIPALWVDIDCAKQEISGDTAFRALSHLPYPPTIIVNSGGGYHAYWSLEEPIDISGGDYSAVEGALRQLALVLAGDTQCAEVARILRVPGTYNSKDSTRAINDGLPAPVEIEDDRRYVYDFDELCEWLATQRPLLQGKREAPKPLQESDPFVAYARQAGYEPAIDIDAELAAMEHGAEGARSIHSTQIRVTYSMIARGYEDDEIVARILAATEAAAPRDAQWNWRSEEAAIRRDISRSRKKQEEQKERPLAPRPVTIGNAALKLVPAADNDEEPERAPKAAKESKSHTVAVGKAAIGVWKDRHGPVMHANGTTYVYEEGIWLEWDERLAQRLRAIIQEACASLRIEPKTSLLNAAKAYFMDRPELIRHNVKFDEHGLLVASDACLDLKTMQVIDHSPEHFATRKSAASLTGSREHRTLDEFLEGVFCDRDEKREIILTLQEWFGAAVMPLHMKTRAMLKGLLVHGASRCGKTQVSELARHLLGHDHICGSRMSDLSDRFGREPLIGKRGWIADDAIGEAETLDAETYKVVVTGERTSAMRKGGKNWEGKFGIPVMLTANNMPRVKDQSEATYNRSLIASMTNIRPEDAPEPPGYTSIAEKIGAEELTGLLWWAIEGWQRLAARGHFAEPECMKQAGKSFRDDNNPVGAWLAQCAEKDPNNKVARLDLVASFNGWRSLEHDDAKPWGGHTVIRRLRAIMPHLEETKYAGERLFIGVRLNEEGLFAWQRTKETAGFEKKATYSNDKEDVNRWHSPKSDQQNSTANLETIHDNQPRF